MQRCSAPLTRHDVDLLMSMFTDDMEFYHDKGGLTNREQTREGFAKMFGNSPDIRRELVPGSLQVYPIKDFGAIEIGTHRFCHKENGKDDCGNFPFVMIWRKIGDSWKVSRVISYRTLDASVPFSSNQLCGGKKRALISSGKPELAIQALAFAGSASSQT
jgi:ketosteroid isomerase-like protein